MNENFLRQHCSAQSLPTKLRRKKIWIRLEIVPPANEIWKGNCCPDLDLLK